MSPARTRRRISSALTVAVTALGLGLVAPPVTAISTSAPATVDDCIQAPGHARVRSGYQGEDFNSLTRAQSVRMDRALDKKVRKLAKQRGVVNKKGTPRGKWKHRTITIKTYVHVITKADGTGGVAPWQVRRQVAVLNEGFDGRTARNAADTPFRFVLKGLDYTKNDDWYDWAYPEEGADPDEQEAKSALRRGGWKALNIYVAAIGGGGILGYAYYPSDGDLTLDGVVLLTDSLPGGSAAPYNEGDTATHEVGHWLNLAHTFENGCTAPGDMVRDTPYQADGDNIFECDESLDTCTQPGRDPVHNFMSYGDDPCLDAFTRGQSHRMVASWFVYRAFR